MLSSKGLGGKYLHKVWYSDRDALMRGRGTSSLYSQAELELPDIEVNGKNYPESYELDTIPLEPDSTAHTRDIRNPTIRGGTGE